MNLAKFDIFINQAVKMYGGSQLKSLKQTNFFVWQLQKAIKAHKGEGLEVRVWDNKVEGILEANFFLTNEDRMITTDWVTIKVVRHRKELDFDPGEAAQKRLGIAWHNGWERV